MSIFEPYKISPIRFNDRTKQDSISWVSKLSLEKRIIAIGTDFVIFNNRLLQVRSKIFFGAKYRQNQLFVQYSALCRIQLYFLNSGIHSEKVDFERFSRQRKNFFSTYRNPQKTLKTLFALHVSPFQRFILLSLVIYIAHKA